MDFFLNPISICFCLYLAYPGHAVMVMFARPWWVHYKHLSRSLSLLIICFLFWTSWTPASVSVNVYLSSTSFFLYRSGTCIDFCVVCQSFRLSFSLSPVVIYDRIKLYVNTHVPLRYKIRAKWVSGRFWFLLFFPLSSIFIYFFFHAEIGEKKAPEGETQPTTEVDLFISTEKIMVLNTELKVMPSPFLFVVFLLCHFLRDGSYITVCLFFVDVILPLPTPTHTYTILVGDHDGSRSPDDILHRRHWRSGRSDGSA